MPEDLQKKQAYNRQRPNARQDSICFAPFVNMLFAADGTVKACCHNHENSLGRYPEQSIQEIWNSPEANLFRQKMREYRFLSGCHGCKFDYNAGNFDEMTARQFDGFSTRSAYPVMMEFLLDNTCNLECVMCVGELSSSIRKNRDKLPPIRSPYDTKFINQLQEFIPHLKETRFSGSGEPFLVDINYHLWETLIEKNPTCKIVVQTNGTVLNRRSKDFLQRGNFHIGVSLDSIQKENYESIRVNASFDTVISNINYFSDYSVERGSAFTISSCVMRQNWKEIPELVHFCNERKAIVILHKVWWPLQCSLYNLPAHELESIYSGLVVAQLPGETALEKRNKKHFEYFLSVIAGWIEDAKNRTENLEDFYPLSNEELLRRAEAKLATYITEEQTLEADKQNLIELCHSKIGAIINFWDDETQRRKILLGMCFLPAKQLLPSLKSDSVEKLIEKSALVR